MNVTYTLTTSNTASGPFNISGTTSGGALNGVLIENNVPKENLVTGHTVNSVPDTVTGGTITSVGVGDCNGTVKNWNVIAPTSILSFSITGPTYYFYLSEPLASNITINTATVALHVTSDCSTVVDDANIDSPVTILAGQTSASQTTTGNAFSSITHIKQYNEILLSTYGSIEDGGTFVVGPTTVTVNLDTTCQPYQS